MINVHRLKGVTIDAPLPVLTFDEAEAKIANIPGWQWFITPHSAWVDSSNHTLKERVDGNVFTALDTTHASERCAFLDEFPNGEPCINLGYTANTSSPYNTQLYLPDEMTFVFAGMWNNDGTNQSYVFRRSSTEGLEVDSSYYLGFNISGFLTMFLANGQQAARATNYDKNSYDGKLFSFIATYSIDMGGVLYVNNEKQPINSNYTLTQIDHTQYNVGNADNGPQSLGFKGKIGCMGVIATDLSRPENAAYLETLKNYISSKFTLDALTPVA